MNQEIYLLGLNHRTAQVDIREKYALTNVDDFEISVLKGGPVKEVLKLSTCNRVEIVAVAESGQNAMDYLLGQWAESTGGSIVELAEHTYKYKGQNAVTHLFEVAASLDSMVLGEPQILGQLKDSYRKAVEVKTAGTIINRLLHKSFFVAKRVRTETAVASSAVSISYAAVELAKHIFGDMKDKRAMLVGAGEMAELAATHLIHSGIMEIWVANRTFARAQELAKELKGHAIEFEQLIESLEKVDILISSTGAPHTVINAKDMKRVMKKRRNKPMFFIDIAVPRDIDPDVNSIDNAYLYDIDDLKEVVEENLANRKDEAAKAKAIIDDEAHIFGDWIKSLELQPTIVSLLDRGEYIAQKELAKTLKKIGPVNDDTREALEILAKSISKKLLHEPICFLKRRSHEEGSSSVFIDRTRRMFNLDNEKLPEKTHGSKKIYSSPSGTCQENDS